MATSLSDRKAKLEQKAAQLKAQLKALESQESKQRRKQETREKVVIGGAVLAHARLDAAFRTTLLDVLRRAVQREEDVKTVAGIISELQALE